MSQTLIVPDAFVYIAFPHTGTQWFRAVLRQTVGCVKVQPDGRDERLKASQMPDEYKDLPRFGFLRHPRSWMRSHLSRHKELTPLEAADAYETYLEIFDLYTHVYKFEYGLVEGARQFFAEIGYDGDLILHKMENLPPINVAEFHKPPVTQFFYKLIPYWEQAHGQELKLA